MVRDVERESHTGHEVDGWGVVPERLRCEAAIGAVHQPRSRIAFVHGQDVRVIDFGTLGVEPLIARPVTDDGRWVRQSVHVDHVVILDIRRNLDAVLQRAEQGLPDVAHRVALTHHIRILEHLLVGVETVHPETHVEDDVLESELVHHVTRDVNGLVSLDGAREVARLVAFVEEVLDGRPTVQATTIGVKTRVVDQVVALVEQIVCAEHVQREEVRVDGVESNEVASVGVQVQGQTQVPIELKLVVTDQPVVGHIISGPVVGHRGIVQIQLLDVGVDREPSERPQAHRRNREEGVAPLLILESHLDRMVPDVT